MKHHIEKHKEFLDNYDGDIDALEFVTIKDIQLSTEYLRGEYMRTIGFDDEDLNYVDLQHKDLHGVYLDFCIMNRVNLSYTNLSNANFEETELCKSNLVGANLSNACLRGTDLAFSNLTDANLTNANLLCADLTDADLTRVNFTGANLESSCLRDAILYGANLTNADLRSARLLGANLKNVIGLVDLGYDLRRWRFYVQRQVVFGQSIAIVGAGCWRFPLPAAREHWATRHLDNPELHDDIQGKLDRAEQIIKQKNW